MWHLTICESFHHYTGALCTIGALSYGLFSFVRGDQKMQQYMMRARVAAQGGTLMAVVAGVFYMLYQERQAKGGKTWKWYTVTVRLGTVGVAFVELRTTASAEKGNCTKGGLQVLCFNKMVMQLVQCKLCSDEFHHWRLRPLLLMNALITNQLWFGKFISYRARVIIYSF